MRVVDAFTFEVVVEIECGVWSIRIAFTSDGRYVLVFCLFLGDLVVIDAAARQIKMRVALADFVAPLVMWVDKSQEEQQALVQRVVAEGARPIGALATPDGSTVYVAARGQKHIVAIETETWSIVQRLPAGAGPDGLAWSVLH